MLDVEHLQFRRYMTLQRKLLRYENQFIVPFHYIKEFSTSY